MKSGSNRHRTRAALAAPLALALGATLAPDDARGASKLSNPYQQVVPKTFEYNTTGVVRAGNKTVHGPNQLSFSGIPSATYVTGSDQPIQLGQFVVKPATAPNGAAAVTTYDNTPFVIQVHAPQFDKSKSVPVLSSILPNFGKALNLKTATINSLLIKGHLDGTVNADGASTVTATVDSTRLGSIKGGPKNTASSYTFPVRATDLKLPTSWTMNTTARALASTAATPAGATAAANIGATPAAAATSAPAASATAANIGSTPTVAAAVVPASAPAAEVLAASTPSITSSLAANPQAQALAVPAGDEITAGSAAPTPAPEPSTFALFGAALAGLAWNRRRRAAR